MFAHARGKPLAFASSLATARSPQEQRVRNIKGCAALAYARVETQSKDSLDGFGRFCLRGFVVFLYISERTKKQKSTILIKCNESDLGIDC